MKSMMKTLQKMLTNNWMLKIVAFIVAAIIWLAVINVNDPTKTVTINNIPISIVNEEVITSNNQVYTVSSKQYVNVTVSGRRSVVKDLSAASFVAEASMEEISMTNAIPVSVSLKNKNLSGKVTVSKQSVSQVMVDIEKIVEKNYPVESNITGAVGQNYELGEVELAKNVVKITAPESVHEKIHSVVVNVNVDGATADFSEKYKVVMLDQNGNQIKTDDNTSLSNKKIQAAVQVYKLKKVPIVVETSGNPADGYEIKNVETDPEEVTISGAAAKINEIKEIRISGDEADISGISTDVEKTVDLTNYIVNGVYIKGNPEVKLSITVEGNVTKKFTIKSTDIDIEGLSQDYEVEILSDSAVISFTGKERDFEGVSASSFHAAIDLKGLKEGKKSVSLVVTVPSGLELVKNDKVKIKITKKEK